MDNNQLITLLVRPDQDTIDLLTSIDQTLKNIYQFNITPNNKTTREQLHSAEIRGVLRKLCRLIDERLPQIPDEPEEQTPEPSNHNSNTVNDSKTVNETLSIANFLETDLSDFLSMLDIDVRTFNGINRKYAPYALTKEFYWDYINYHDSMRNFLKNKFRNIGAKSADKFIEALIQHGLFHEGETK